MSGMLDMANVDAFVEDMMEDPNINATWVPDAMEKKLYTGVFKMLISAFHKFITGVNVEVMGYKIGITMTTSNKKEGDELV